MVRFIVLWKNTPTDVSAFERHYREVHVPLAKKLAGLRRYTLSRDASVVRGEEPHYRIAELDWDDMASLRRAFESPEGQAVADRGEGVPGVALDVRLQRAQIRPEQCRQHVDAFVDQVDGCASQRSFLIHCVVWFHKI